MDGRRRHVGKALAVEHGEYALALSGQEGQRRTHPPPRPDWLDAPPALPRPTRPRARHAQGLAGHRDGQA
jgi:hypothetical protein